MIKDTEVGPETYTADYFTDVCSGMKFLTQYGAAILKPDFAVELKRVSVHGGMTAVDVGCGRGELLMALATKGCRVFGYDYSEEALKLAGEYAAKLPAEIRGRITMQKVDAKKIPLPDGAANLVFFNDIVEHLTDREVREAFLEIKRILAPGGKLLIHTGPNRTYYKFLVFGFCRALAGVAAKAGLKLKLPTNPRSEWDEKVHINEQSFFSLRRLLSDAGFAAEIELLPNMRYMVDEVYGGDLPEAFPIKPVRGARAWFFKKVLFRFPLKMLLARNILAVAVPE